MLLYPDVVYMFHSYLAKFDSLNKLAPSVGVVMYNSAAKMCFMMIALTFSIIYSRFNLISSFSLNCFSRSAWTMSNSCYLAAYISSCFFIYSRSSFFKLTLLLWISLIFRSKYPPFCFLGSTSASLFVISWLLGPTGFLPCNFMVSTG